MATILGSKVLESFERDLPKTNVSFILKRKKWMTLQTEGPKLKPEWGNVMSNKLKDSNPYCLFAFKRYWLKNHRLSSLKDRKNSSMYAFKAGAYCTVVSELRITTEDMNRSTNDITVNITYSGKIRHCEKKACYINQSSFGASMEELRGKLVRMSLMAPMLPLSAVSWRALKPLLLVMMWSAWNSSSSSTMSSRFSQLFQYQMRWQSTDCRSI